MPRISRLADSCLLLTTESGTTLVDPGFFTFESDRIDLDGIGEVQRVLITHEHRDHLHPEFVRWLVDRGDDVTVHANPAVAELLADHDLEVETGEITGVTFEDVDHEALPVGPAPPNRSFTLDGLLTHPGDSYQPSATGTVLALPLITPWGSMTKAVDFARRLRPRQVVPIHDFYLGDSGRRWVYGLAKRALAAVDIELVALDWGEGYQL